MGELARPNAKAFLRVCGYTSDLVSQALKTDRLVHDMNIDGDSLDEILMILRDKFGVNLDDFVFSDYSPDEFFWPRNLCDFLAPGRRKRVFEERFRPLTLEMIEEAIVTQRWSERH